MWRAVLRQTFADEHVCGPVRLFGNFWRSAASASGAAGATGHSGENYEELVRYARQIRAESNIQTVDEPPTAPLPEEHEVGPGESDFCNYLDDHSDSSNRQMVQGLGLATGLLALLAAVSVYRFRHSERAYEPRTVPFWDKEIFGEERKEPLAWEEAPAKGAQLSMKDQATLAEARPAALTAEPGEPEASPPLQDTETATVSPNGTPPNESSVEPAAS
jgi:hypothetical protein